MRKKIITRFTEAWQRAKPDNRDRAVEFLITTYDRFIRDGLADREFAKQLTTGTEEVYAQRVSELLLADWLWRDGFSLTSANAVPDFKAVKEGISIWLELITPIPNGIDPIDQRLPQPSEPPVARDEPHGARLLRWTSAIHEKAQKLNGYLKKGVVKPEEPYIIVVNPRRLNPWHIDINGISQLPYPVEVCFGVGPMQFQIKINHSRNTTEIHSANHQQRLCIPKPNGSPVPANTFLDSSFSAISAVLGIDLDNIGMPPFDIRPYHSALVYNPHAENPISDMLISANEHWKCELGDDFYEIYRIPENIG